MQNKVANVAATSDPALGRPQVSVRQEPVAGPPAAPPAPQPVDVRLVIEEDRASGAYVYKTVNRATGEVILQLPRAELLRMREGARYAAGGLIRTQA